MVDTKRDVERLIREATVNVTHAANQISKLNYEPGDQPSHITRAVHRAILQGIAAQLDQISLMYGEPPPDRSIK